MGSPPFYPATNLRWIFLLLSTLLAACLAGCASNTLAQISSLTPSVVQQGKPAIVSVHIESGHNDMQVALLPAGPYITHQYKLEQIPLAIGSNGKYTFLVTSETTKNDNTSTSQLKIFRFNSNGTSEIVGRLSLIDGQITKLAYENDHLLLASGSGNVYLINVLAPSSPAIEARYTVVNEISALQYNGESCYLLLGNNELQQIDFSVSNKAQPIRQWKLPVPTETFAVKGNNLWAVGTDGITVMALDDTARVTDHFTTSAIPGVLPPAPPA